MSLMNPKNKRIVIVSEHFYPSDGATAQLLADLADDLFSNNVNLVVLTSTTGAHSKPYPVYRFGSLLSKDSRIFSKLFSGLLFFFRTIAWLAIHLRPEDSLFIVSNPPFIGLIGPLFYLFRHSRYIFLFQDIFPRSASLTGVLPAKGPLESAWRSATSVVIRCSTATVVLSSSMIRRCRIEYGSDHNIISIPNWAVLSPQSIDKTNTQLATKLDLKNTLTIQYSGNFGRLHDILTLLEAARCLQSYNVKFVFIGSGAKYNQIITFRDYYNLTNLVVMPHQPRSLLADSISASDISIVSLVPGAEDTVAPSKFYGIIASSRPVLLLSSKESELSDIISSNGCGYFIQTGDVQSLCNIIIYLLDNPLHIKRMGENSLCLYKSRYGRDRSVSQYLSLFKKCDMI